MEVKKDENGKLRVTATRYDLGEQQARLSDFDTLIKDAYDGGLFEVGNGFVLPEKILETISRLEEITAIANEAEPADKNAADYIEGLTRALNKAKVLYNNTQHKWLIWQYAPEINEREVEFWKLPYKEYVTAFIAYEANRFGNATERMAKSIIEPEKWAAFKEAHGSIESHFTKVWAAIERDNFTDDSGNAVVTVENGVVDATPIFAALEQGGFDLESIVGVELQGKDGNVITPSEAKPRFAKDEETEDEILLLDIDGEDFTLAYPFDYFGIMYLTLYALVALMNCENAVDAIAYPKLVKKRKKKNTALTEIRTPIDGFSQDFFRPGNKTALQPDDYFTSSEPENAIQVRYHKGTRVLATMRINSLIDYNSATTRDLFTPIDGFWYSIIYSLARSEKNRGEDGNIVISSFDILKAAGIKNPYDDSAIGTMQSAYKSVCKFIQNFEVLIDVTEEAMREGNEFGEDLDMAIGFQPILDGKRRILRSKDNEFAFEVVPYAKPGEALKAFPLARYSEKMGQMVEIPRELFEFKRVRASLEHRCMFKYVWERINEKGTGNEILVDTLFANSLEDLEGVTVGEADPNATEEQQKARKARYDKRRKLVIALEKMLDEKQQDGFLTWEWIEPGVKFKANLTERKGLPAASKR